MCTISNIVCAANIKLLLTNRFSLTLSTFRSACVCLCIFLIPYKRIHIHGHRLIPCQRLIPCVRYPFKLYMGDRVVCCWIKGKTSIWYQMEHFSNTCDHWKLHIHLNISTRRQYNYIQHIYKSISIKNCAIVFRSISNTYRPSATYSSTYTKPKIWTRSLNVLCRILFKLLK